MSPQAQPTFVTTGSYPTRPENRLRLLLDGEAAFRRVAEAIEGAQRSVWATLTFMWPEFRLPDGRGTALDVLGRAAQRGVEVRLLCWRPDGQTASLRRNAFWGAPEHLAALRALEGPVGVRWDCAQPGYCQHQKTWLIDAGTPGAVAFLGGLNLNPHSLVAPGHHGAGQNHDLYLELAGPAVADLHHNFAQRWNEASERRREGGWWGQTGTTDLPFPTDLPAACGAATVQVQRTIHPGLYRHGAAPAGGLPFDIAAGERTIYAQTLQMIRSAQRTLYLENQYLEVPEIVQALHLALQRGVEVVAVLPAAYQATPAAYATPERQAFFQTRAALAHYPNFTLTGLAGLGAQGVRHPVWIHSKLLLADDTWGTVGSANLHRYSLFGNSELNATFWEPDWTRALRSALFAEHLDMDTSGLDDLAALRTFRSVALNNEQRRLAGTPAWQGLAFALDITRYGL